jgi:plasmid replication initiation protein
MTEPLLPVRHPKNDLFICDLGDVIPKSDIASMEHPLFTLSTKPDTNIRSYEHNGNTVTIIPSAIGLATIHDKDILIYCISQLMAGINRGQEPSNIIRFKAHDLLVSTNRQTDGDGYKRLNQALDRLSGALIKTNIKTNNEIIDDRFHILDSATIIRENPIDETSRMVEIKIKLSDWLYNAVLGKEVLSINQQYFRLRKPIERRIYEIARKHCGNQKKWHIGLKNLHKKVGSSGNVRLFKQAVKHIIENNHLPDYSLHFDGDNIVFRNKNWEGEISQSSEDRKILLSPETVEKAKKILGREFDVYVVESEWLKWIEGKEVAKTTDGAFIGFCKNKIVK